MKVRIVFDPFDKEYIAFIEGVHSFSGYGSTEEEAIVNFLHQCENNSLFNQSKISLLLHKFNES